MNDSSKRTRNYWKYAFWALFSISVIISWLGLKCVLGRTSVAVSTFYCEKSYKDLQHDFDALAKLFFSFQSSISPDKLLNEAHKQGLATEIDKTIYPNRINVGRAIFAFDRDGKLLWIKHYDEAR